MGRKKKGRKSKKTNTTAKQKKPTKQGVFFSTATGRNDTSEVFISGLSVALTWRIIAGFLTTIIIICGFIVVYYHKVATELDSFKMVKDNQSCMIRLLHEICDHDEEIDFPSELLAGESSSKIGEAESSEEQFVAVERHVSSSTNDNIQGEK